MHGSIFRFEGQVTVFKPYEGPCYRCLLPEPPPPELAPSCAEAGVLGVLPGIIGSIQALEAIKLLLDLGDPLIGRLLAYDALEESFRTFKVRRDPQCPACGENAAPIVIAEYDELCLPHAVLADGTRALALRFAALGAPPAHSPSDATRREPGLDGRGRRIRPQGRQGRADDRQCPGRSMEPGPRHPTRGRRNERTRVRDGRPRLRAAGRDAFDGELDGQLRYWRDGLPTTRHGWSPTQRHGDDVVAIGPDLPRRVGARARTRALDPDRPDISVVIIAQPSTNCSSRRSAPARAT